VLLSNRVRAGAEEEVQAAGGLCGLCCVFVLWVCGSSGGGEAAVCGGSSLCHAAALVEAVCLVDNGEGRTCLDEGGAWG
jgi:hypothetical protein